MESTATPTTFVDDAPELHSQLVDRGYAPRMVFVTVESAPVWHDGDIVARVTGKFPAAYPDKYCRDPLVLLDNGTISALAHWRIDKEASDWRSRWIGHGK